YTPAECENTHCYHTTDGNPLSTSPRKRREGAGMTTDGYDVAVVGAGPGGSAAAITLARAGLRVALLDRQAFPRTKPCGDLIGCGGVALARTLGVPAETLAPYRPLRGAVVIAPQTRPLVLRGGGR